MEIVEFNALCAAKRKAELLGELAHQYTLMMMRVLNGKRGLPDQVKEDIVQDQLIDMALNCEKRSHVENIGAYLNMSASRDAFDWFKFNKRHEPPPEGGEIESPSDDGPPKSPGDFSASDIGADPALQLQHKQLRDYIEECLYAYLRITKRRHMFPAIWEIMVNDMSQTQAWKLSNSKDYNAFRTALTDERPTLRKCFASCWDMLKGALS